MEKEKRRGAHLSPVGVSGFNINVKLRKSLRKQPDNGKRGGKITVVEMDPGEMALVFAFEPHPITFS